MATLDEVNAQIAKLRAQLNSGVTMMAENGRVMKFDVATIRAQLAELEAQAVVLDPARQPIRRVLTYTPSKGY